MHQTAQAILWLQTPGKKWFGLQNLKLCRNLMTDLEHAGIFHGMLLRHGIPLNLDQIDVTDDYPSGIPDEIPMSQPSQAYDQPLSDADFESYAAFLSGDITHLNMGGSFNAPYGDLGASPSTPSAPLPRARPQRDTRHPQQLTYSPFQRVRRAFGRRD